MSFVEIEGIGPTDPKTQVVVIGGIVRAMAEQAGEDPAYAAMLLLTAAAHLGLIYAKSGTDMEAALTEALMDSLMAARGWYFGDGETVQ